MLFAQKNIADFDFASCHKSFGKETFQRKIQMIIRTRKRGKRKRGTEDETDITEQGTGACAPSQV